LSRRLLLLNITGRQSGRTFALPVGYARRDSEIIVTVGAPERKHWWRNVDGPTPVVVLLRGHTQRGVARLDKSHGSTEVHIALSGEPVGG
jgi:hypothetical protein